jgi:hypothetical protein
MGASPKKRMPPYSQLTAKGDFDLRLYLDAVCTRISLFATGVEKRLRLQNQ